MNETPLITALRRTIDPGAVVLTLYAVLRLQGHRFTSYDLVLAVVAFFIASLVFDDLDVFEGAIRRKQGLLIARILTGWVITIGILMFLGYAAHFTDRYSASTMADWFVATPFVQWTAHLGARTWIKKRHRRGGARKLVIAGSNDLGVRLARQIERNPHLMMQFMGFCDDRGPERQAPEARKRMIGTLAALPRYVEEQGIDIVLITLPMAAQSRIKYILDALDDTTVSVYYAPDLFLFNLIQAHFVAIDGTPVLALRETPLSSVDVLNKRLSDLVLATLILILVSPLMLLIALGIKITSPRGPILFRQRRYGLDGKPIMVYKFRTMRVCEDGAEIRQATRNDARITPLGGFLRRTSLDELPQFLNVLQGSMSIVGPRPHAVAHNELYRKLIQGYMMRHKVKPGITGWAQVNGYRGETEALEKMQQRVCYDVDYMRSWSLGFDLRIILRTLVVLFKDRHKAY
ncbi:MAG: undecaprenyl-phosphate glucose phosphotransferase [Acidiferrobacteraceae bacterium]